MTRQRQLLLARLRRWLDGPMALLGLTWLALVVGDLLDVSRPWMGVLSNAIRLVFVLDFLLELWLAPSKLAYVRHNWLTLLSLMAPALRMLRIVRIARALRVARVARGLRLLCAVRPERPGADQPAPNLLTSMP